MLKFADYDIVFQEVPDEVTLAINLSNCPHLCEGCHSPYLRKNVGEVLNEVSMATLLQKYQETITCVCFMGGDASPEEVCRMSEFVKKHTNGSVKTAWYSGYSKLQKDTYMSYFDFIKLGPYMPLYGGLNKKTTNQRMYRVDTDKLVDITARMQR